MTSHRAAMCSATQLLVARVTARRHFFRARQDHLFLAAETCPTRGVRTKKYIKSNHAPR